MKNGITYKPIDTECDTHYAFGGVHMVIYVTTDPRAGAKIVDIGFSDKYFPFTSVWNNAPTERTSGLNLRYGAPDGKPRYLLFRRADNSIDADKKTASVFFKATVPFALAATGILIISGAGALFFKKRRIRKADKTNNNMKEGM